MSQYVDTETDTVDPVNPSEEHVEEIPTEEDLSFIDDEVDDTEEMQFRREDDIFNEIQSDLETIAKVL